MFFFFNDTATTEIYTLSLHDALPISQTAAGRRAGRQAGPRCSSSVAGTLRVDFAGGVDNVLWSRLGSGPLFGLQVSRSEEHTSELQSQSNLVCRLLLEKKKQNIHVIT